MILMFEDKGAPKVVWRWNQLKPAIAERDDLECTYLTNQNSNPGRASTYPELISAGQSGKY